MWLAEKQLFMSTSHLSSRLQNIAAAFYCTVWDTPNPGSHLTAAESQAVTHINKHTLHKYMHIQMHTTEINID